MNKVRRTSLQEISVKMEDLKSDIEALRDEEQEYADNMPDSLQSSEKHDTAENAVSSMDEAIEGLESAINAIGQSIDS